MTNLINFYNFVPAVSVPDFMTINKLSKKYRVDEDVKTNLMRGMITCSYCGENMSAGLTSKNTAKGTVNYFYYRCQTAECSQCNKSVRAKVVLDYIYDYLGKKPFSSKEHYDHYIKEVKRISEQDVRRAYSSIGLFEAKKRRIEERIEDIKVV